MQATKPQEIRESVPSPEKTQDCVVPLHSGSLHDLASPINQICTMLELYRHRRESMPGVDCDFVLTLIESSASRLQTLMAAMQKYERVISTPFVYRNCEGNAL